MAHRPHVIAIAPSTVFGLLALFLALRGLAHFATLVCLGWIAVIAATALRPLVDYFVARRFPRPLGVVVVLAGLGGLLALLVILVVPVVLEQAQTLVRDLPRYAGAWSTGLARFEVLHTRFPAIPELPRLGAQAATWLAASLSGWLTAGIALTVQLVGLFAGVLVVGFTTLYLLLDGDRLVDGLLRLLPWRMRPLVAAQLPAVAVRLGAYVRGQLMTMAALSAMLMVGLNLIRLPYAGLLAILAGAFEIVPWLGSTMGITLSSLVALAVDWRTVPLVWLVFGVCNFIQGNVLGPIIMSRTVSVPPVLVIFVILVGSETLGLLGVIVAVPTLAVVLLLVENLWVPRMDPPAAIALPPAAPESAAGAS